MREELLDIVHADYPGLSNSSVCQAFGIPRSSVYYQPRADEVGNKRRSPRTLLDEERQQVLDTLHSDRFVDSSPREVYGTLLDEQKYICSVRTMYRILAAEGEAKDRRNQRRHRNDQKPELVATGVNMLWSWDITQLKGSIPGLFYHLYVILDVYSRYVVGWLISERSRAEHAERLIRETAIRQQVSPNVLTLHSDNGKQMIAKNVSQLLAGLGVTRSLNRPHVSNDNPYSESGFKTLKYHPSFPERFGSLEDARLYCQSFFKWYNTEHHHTGLGLLTPECVHSGKAEEVIKNRQKVLNEVYKRFPERFVNGIPKHPELPKDVWINKPDGVFEKE